MGFLIILSASDTDIKVAEVKLKGYYEPMLLPDYLPHDFDLKIDKLVQHNIIDSKGKLIPCWDNLDKLRPGTLVLCVVSLHVWNIPNRDNWFRRVSRKPLYNL